MNLLNDFVTRSGRTLIISGVHIFAAPLLQMSGQCEPDFSVAIYNCRSEKYNGYFLLTSDHRELDLRLPRVCLYVTNCLCCYVKFEVGQTEIAEPMFCPTPRDVCMLGPEDITSYDFSQED